MCLEEKRVWFTLVAFGAVALVCVILIMVGHETLGWQRRHLLLICLSLTAGAHIARLLYYAVCCRQEENGAIVRDERDREISARASRIAWRLGAGLLFAGCMMVFITRTYHRRTASDLSSLLLVVLTASLAVMLGHSIASIVLYRSQRNTHGIGN